MHNCVVCVYGRVVYPIEWIIEERS
jgi:hypothetical protein